MTKEEVIKAAYGENWELVKDKVNKDGWIKDREFIFSDFVKGIDWQTTDHDDEFYDTRRPKQLKGIEDNCGWTKIESEKDLPQDINHVYVVARNKEILFKSGVAKITVDYLYATGKITHYQQIQEFKPPIF